MPTLCLQSRRRGWQCLQRPFQLDYSGLATALSACTRPLSSWGQQLTICPLYGSIDPDLVLQSFRPNGGVRMLCASQPVYSPTITQR